MLPRSVKIGAHIYKLKTSTRKELGPDTLGYTDNEQNVIQVLRYATRSRKIEIVLHECLHAMLEGYEFPQEEVVVNRLGEALSRFLADNPRFIAEAMAVLSEQKKP